MSLTPNPSHLEVVNAVVLGKVRAKQDLAHDQARIKVLGLLLHGDAAFSGQGSVMEALSLSRLQAYHTGGTVHVVTNNQIGFTTNPDDSRSTSYSTDIAKFISAPILHVNGDDAEAVVFAAKLVAEYRAIFKKDVVLDIVGYRKYGHNEGDEPMYTQPKMYNAIKVKETPPQVFVKKLIGEQIITQEEFEQHRAKFKEHLDQEFIVSQGYKPIKPDWLEGNWSSLEPAPLERSEPKTGLDVEQLKDLGLKTAAWPKDFHINSKLARQLDERAKNLQAGTNLDWAAGESLAFASLLTEGYNIRMTGQDVERGTFSHRHAVMTDQENETRYVPLNNLSSDQNAFLEIKNSNLSEFAVLAFEYGYSFTNPKTLTIWEAQFGDFANGAQVVIDQYVSSGEAKWLRMSGLVMLLPHGYDGQGPEHSSARLERFLQLCADDNMQVVNCTTPASIYHALRRQLHRNFRKPLVVMSPKSLLRHPLAVSSLADFDSGTTFKPVLGDEAVKESAVKKVLICSGKVYYDLVEKRKELKRDDVAIVRLEQIYPFADNLLGQELKKYPNAEILWCQEEHQNMGAYHFVEPRIEKVLSMIQHKCKRAKYVGRESSASPAVGYVKLHQIELKKLLEEAFL
jgi:2-oxoglutarate dehydrogenase E1 component